MRLARHVGMIPFRRSEAALDRPARARANQAVVSLVSGIGCEVAVVIVLSPFVRFQSWPSRRELELPRPPNSNARPSANSSPRGASNRGVVMSGSRAARTHRLGGDSLHPVAERCAVSPILLPRSLAPRRASASKRGSRATCRARARSFLRARWPRGRPAHGEWKVRSRARTAPPGRSCHSYRHGSSSLRVTT